LTIVISSPPSELPSAVASKTQMSARPIPAVSYSPSGKGVFVARLVADVQRAHDARDGTGYVDDTHAVREEVHYPDLAVVARRHRTGLHAHLHGAGVRERSVDFDIEDLELIIRRVHREESRVVGRNGEWTHL
jgi:hypothetical protein